MIDTSANVIISKANEVFLRVNAEPHIEYELRDHFTFQVEGAKFMPQYRNRNWNGEIHLFDLRSKRIYVGLLDRIVAFCKKHDYSYKFVENEYFSGKADPSIYIENPFPKKIRDKDTMQKYLDADEKLSTVSLKIDYYDTMLVYLESILKVIQNRTYQIKNAIEFMRFQSGLG